MGQPEDPLVAPSQDPAQRIGAASDLVGDLAVVERLPRPWVPVGVRVAVGVVVVAGRPDREGCRFGLDVRACDEDAVGIEARADRRLDRRGHVARALGIDAAGVVDVAVDDERARRAARPAPQTDEPQRGGPLEGAFRGVGDVLGVCPNQVLRRRPERHDVVAPRRGITSGGPCDQHRGGRPGRGRLADGPGDDEGRHAGRNRRSHGDPVGRKSPRLQQHAPQGRVCPSRLAFGRNDDGEFGRHRPAVHRYLAHPSLPSGPDVGRTILAGPFPEQVRRPCGPTRSHAMRGAGTRRRLDASKECGRDRDRPHDGGRWH